VREALGDGTLYLDKFREFIDNSKFFRRMVSLVEPREPLAVLCHGDCWTNNILFRYSEEGEILEVRNTYLLTTANCAAFYGTRRFITMFTRAL
jgi:hypothetical protein